jgi:putative flippase GtrA
MSVSLESLMRDPAAPDQSAPLWIGLVSFLIIGAGAALAYVALCWVAMRIPTGLSPWIVSSICYAVFIVPVYLMHRRYSFRSDAPHVRALPRYIMVQICGLILATLFSLLAYNAFGLPTPLAAFLVIGLTSGVNFVVLRLWAFSHS